MARTQFSPDSRFSPDGEFVVNRSNIYLRGTKLPLGSFFPKNQVSARRLRQLFEARRIGRPAGYVEPAKPPRRRVDNSGLIVAALKAAHQRDRTVAPNNGPHLDATFKRSEDVEEIKLVETASLPTAPLEKLAAAVPKDVVAHPVKPGDAPTYDAQDMGISPIEAAPKPSADFLGRGGAAAKKKTARSKQKATA